MYTNKKGIIQKFCFVVLYISDKCPISQNNVATCFIKSIIKSNLHVRLSGDRQHTMVNGDV